MAPQASEQTSSNLELQNNDKSKKLEILYNGWFYDVTSFVPRHPGGSVIKFYTEPGEDATLAIQQFHYRSMDRITNIMKNLPRRPLTGATDKSNVGMSIKNLKRHESLTEDFQLLKKELEEEGLFQPSIPHVIIRWSEILVWVVICLSFRLNGWNWTATFLTGIGGARAGMLNHEAGHFSMTGNPKIDRMLDSFLFGFFSGLSASWWRSQHNRHHAMPQRIHRDVDLETMPFIAFNKCVLRNPNDGTSFFIRYQKYLFATLDTALVIPYWKLILHPRYMLKKREYLDMLFIAAHYTILFGVMQSSILEYWVGVWIATTYLFVIFAMNHSHLDVTSEKLHWVEYCLLHTVDVTAHWAVDIWMNFLNYQIEHHLFPAMPQFRQRRVKERVKALAQKHGLPYRTLGFWEALKMVFTNLEKVSNAAAHNAIKLE